MKRTWENVRGCSLREVLEATYDKPAEEITVDNQDLAWYQSTLDETILCAFRKDASTALVTDNLAWVDHPTQIHVHIADDWMAEESPDWIALGGKMDVINPWTGVISAIASEDVTEERLDALAPLMDDEIREALHMELAPCSPWAFWKEYVERVGPDEAGRIWFS